MPRATRPSVASRPASDIARLEHHLAELKSCARCPGMIGPVITPRAVAARVYLVGQAPGPREGALGRPFAWTAGRTLFAWFASIGVDEEAFRSRAYIAAVCRCFPGKANGGGDRVPGVDEIEACSGWMRREIGILRPRLIVPVGRLAIERFMPPAPLAEIIGQSYRVCAFGHDCEVIPLPHPSGASTWFKREPGRGLLRRALDLLGAHPAWSELTVPPLPRARVTARAPGALDG